MDAPVQLPPVIERTPKPGAKRVVGLDVARGLLMAYVLIVIHGRHLPALETFQAWLDPFRRAEGHAYMMLSWHLWFVTPFLVVTALMPILARWPVWRMAPLWVWAASAALIVLAVDTYWLR